MNEGTALSFAAVASPFPASVRPDKAAAGRSTTKSKCLSAVLLLVVVLHSCSASLPSRPFYTLNVHLLSIHFQGGRTTDGEGVLGRPDADRSTRTMSSVEAKRKEVASLLRSCLMSSKGGVPLEKVQRKYDNLTS